MFENYAHYPDLRMQPLQITAKLGSAPVSYQGLHFDSILAAKVVEEATDGQMLPQSPHYTFVPLPLKILWHSAVGVPLWASTDLVPNGEVIRDVQYMHRRALEPKMQQKNIITKSGRHKEKRTPMPIIVANQLSCNVYGNAKEIARLLSNVTSIGKKRHSAGMVMEWIVEPVDEFSLVKGVKARRPLPVPAIYDAIASVNSSHISYSPPYWLPATRDFCVPTGADVHIDQVTMELIYA